MAPQHLTPWRRHEVVTVVALYLSGWRLDVIGALFGRPWGHVSELLQRPGIV